MEKLFIIIIIFIVTSLFLLAIPTSSTLKEVRNFAAKKIGKTILIYGIAALAVVAGIYFSEQSDESYYEESYSIYEDPYYEGEGEYARIEKEKEEDELLQSADDSIEKRSIQLIDAVEAGDLETVRDLLDKGVDFSYTNYDGWSAMHIAAEQCNAELIQLLLDHGMEVEPADFDTTPLSYMLHSNDESIEIGFAEILNGYTDYPRTFEVVRILLEHGSNPNAVDGFGMTPLMHAAGDNNIEVMKRLLENGAYLDAVDEYGWTALMHASQDLALQSVEFLVGEGANTRIIATRDNGGVDSAGLNARELAEWTYRTHNMGTSEHLAKISAVLGDNRGF
jgi:ankyrin repeat protein